jgi:hypothetical protein
MARIKFDYSPLWQFGNIEEFLFPEARGNQEEMLKGGDFNLSGREVLEGSNPTDLAILQGCSLH